jgi:hypothetical protein
MSAVLPKDLSFVRFPPAVQEDIDQQKRLKRFGLPSVGPSLLSGQKEWQDVSTKCEAFAHDAVQAVESLLGMPRTRSIFFKALARPKTGKSPNLTRNLKLLAEYDSELAKNPGAKRQIARQMAKKKHPENLAAAESLAHHIRTLVVNRKKAHQKLAALLTGLPLTDLPSTLLEEATDIKHP